jgi:serine/threonine protein kinase
MIGQTISHYKILEKLGEGGMGVVYKAEDTKLKRTVALKFLPNDLTQDIDARERFAAEAQAASGLEHSGICTIYDIDQTSDGELFICMAYYGGETLKTRIERGAMPTAEAVDITTQIAEGLARAHEAGIIHRDIKPSNVVITERGEVKIIDFGLSKLVGEKGLTKSGTTLGTIGYMSPEHVQGEVVDHRADIWALGVIIYEMLAGNSPFHGEYEVATIYSIVNEEPEPITGLRTDVPLELERIVGKCLKKEPAERYQHMEELITDLSPLPKGLESDATDGRPSRKRARAGSIFKKKPVLLGALTGLSILTFILLWFLVPSKSLSVDNKSIAVLPFDNLNPEKDTDYFSAGITEDIRTQLSKIGDMVVISKAAMQRYKDGKKSPREIASELNVATLLAGSVRRAGDQLRIGCQLIDAETEAQIWAETYDREMMLPCK